MFLRSLILIFLGLFIMNYPGFSQEVQTKPTALFSAVFWDRFTSKNVTYAPWGNYDDKNATWITLQVGFSTPSLPFAYYGKSPIRFFETIFSEDENQEGSSEKSKFQKTDRSDRKGSFRHLRGMSAKVPGRLQIQARPRILSMAPALFRE